MYVPENCKLSRALFPLNSFVCICMLNVVCHYLLHVLDAVTNYTLFNKMFLFDMMISVKVEVRFVGIVYIAK